MLFSTFNKVATKLNNLNAEIVHQVNTKSRSVIIALIKNGSKEIKIKVEMNDGHEGRLGQVLVSNSDNFHAVGYSRSVKSVDDAFEQAKLNFLQVKSLKKYKRMLGA